MKHLYLVLVFICTTQLLQAQFGYGINITNDLYQRFTNPESENDADIYRSAGSLLLNFGIGPKIWVGAPRFSFSLESSANIGLLGLALKDFKGMGTHHIPVIGRLNFGGLSGLDKEGKFGWSIGGGVQFNKTELYYTSDKYETSLDRNYFTTYVGQVAYGFGISGFSIQGVLRVGYNPDTKANSFNFGFQYDFNIPKLKQISNPESEL